MLSDDHIAITLKGNRAVFPVHRLDRDPAESTVDVRLNQRDQTCIRLQLDHMYVETRLPEGQVLSEDLLRGPYRLQEAVQRLVGQLLTGRCGRVTARPARPIMCEGPWDDDLKRSPTSTYRRLAGVSASHPA